MTDPRTLFLDAFAACPLVAVLRGLTPGESEAVMYNGWVRPEFHAELIRHKVRHAAILNELVQTNAPDVAVSPKPRPALRAHTN